MAESRDHLERLIFEVHGAEKGAEMLEKLRKQEEKYAQSLKGLKKQAQETAKAEVKAAKDVEEAQKKRAAATQQTMKVTSAALVALAAAAVKAYADLERADGRLERSAKKAGVAQTDLARTMGQVDAKARQLGLGLVDQREAMSKLIDATGDLQTAQSDLALINDIVATGDADLKGAIELVTKARKGEVEELKRLDGINKTTIEAMGAIADNTQRGAEAISLLKREYAGAADTLKGTEDAFANLKQAGTDLLEVIGTTGTGLINAFSEFIGVIRPGESLIDQFAVGMRNFAAEAKEAASYLDVWVEWQKQGAIFGDESFGDVMSRRDSAAAQGADGGSIGARSPVGNRGRRNYAGYRGPAGATPTQPAADKPKRGRGEDPTLEGFIGDFDQVFESLEEVRGAEAQALQEREDRRQTFINNSRRYTDEEIANWQREQQAFIEHQDKMKEASQEAAEARAQAREIDLQSAMAGANAAMGIADSLIKNEGVRLGMQSVSTAAQAAVLFARALAPPNPITGDGPQNMPAAIAMSGAAVELGIAAAMAGGGGGKKAGPKKGGGSRGGGGMQMDRERVSLQSEQSRSRESRAPQTQVVNVYSTFGPSPQQSRELVDAVEREMRNRTTTRRM